MARKRRRNPSSSFWKPLRPTAKLAAVIGDKPATRTEMVSRLWKYIHSHKLQSRTNRRMVKTDAALRAVCNGKRQVNMFDMTKMAHRQLK